MRTKVYWGLGVLILLLGAAAVFIIQHEIAENRELKKQLAEAKKLANQIKEQEALKNNPPVAREGYKMVPHGDHWHEVPIDAPDTWQGEPHGEVVTEDDIPLYQPPPTQTYDGPLTYHAELLETNPVKALRLQSEERGHWSKDWIPPFPPDDVEAQTYARARYLLHYYESIGDTDNPAYKEAVDISLSMVDTIMTYGFGARTSDLLKLTWPNLRAGAAVHTDSTPSDYFPNYHTEKGRELLRPYYEHLLGDHENQTEK